jgi:hypothetical protein
MLKALSGFFAIALLASAFSATAPLIADDEVAPAANEHLIAAPCDQDVARQTGAPSAFLYVVTWIVAISLIIAISGAVATKWVHRVVLWAILPVVATAISVSAAIAKQDISDNETKTQIAEKCGGGQ